MMLIVGGVAAGLLVLGWLLISFREPGPGRVVIEWLSASAMYLVLCAIFGNLVLRALADDNTVALVAFGFLGAMFSIGLLVSLARAIGALAGGSETGTSATN